MNIPDIFSIAFSVACALSLFIGIYALQLNPHSKTNVLFFVLTVTLDFWAFGFSMAVSAGNMEMVLFWRRFSALGWGAFFSVLLHFFHVFTGNDIKKWWAYPALYAPTLVTYLGFTFFPGLNPGQYNMVYTEMGWINVAVNNAWDWFYTAYYFLYALAGFVHIWRWGRKSSNPRIKKQSYLILVSFLLTMMLGSLTDILGNLIFSEKIPQLAPLLMVVPAFVVYYSVKKYGLLNPMHVDEESILMSDQIRKRMTNYMSNAFVFGGILYLVSQYVLFDNTHHARVLIFSGGLFLIGAFLQVVQRFVKRKNMKDILTAVILALTVPILTFQYIQYASVTVWAFAFILLIITMVYSRSFIQIMLFISIIMTQLTVWLIKPVVALRIDSFDHVVRISMFIVAIWFAWFIRRIFQSKLQENAEQLSAQTLVSEISTDFVSISEGNLEEKIEATLSKAGAALRADRCFVYLFDEKKERLYCRSVWFNHEKMTDTGISREIDNASFPRILSCVKAGNNMASADISHVLCETGDELPRLLGSYNKAFAAMPIMNKNQVYGFFGIDTDRKTKQWPETQLTFIQIMSNLFADAFEKIEKENEITQMAFYDYLTKLPNRILFKEKLTAALAAAERTGEKLAVIFLDMDAFKAVNDSAGHDGGDALLIKTAEKLKAQLRKQDVLSRFGGDEFLVLLSGVDSSNSIAKIVQNLLDIFDKPFVFGEQEFFVTASAGIAVWPEDGTEPETLITNADIAMYKAKESGKNCYLFCTEAMKEEVSRKLKLRNNLFRAMERHELRLYYQPQVDVKTKKIVGAEALIRWFHPDGMISPAQFIPLAEQTGLIGPIGDWVLMTACLQCKTWQNKGLPVIRIGINVSASQLRNPEFVYRVAQILEETELDPGCLELEITESATVSEADYICGVLDGLKQLGVSISIDDFGTEYSSLGRLSAMPIDRLKLDMQFIRAIDRGEKQKSIIKGIIGLAHSLDLNIIAEGVETDTQFQFLQERCCDEIQGYYFYRPLQPEDLEKILQESGQA